MSHDPNSVAPVAAPPEQVSGYRSKPSPLFRLALLWNKYAPRAKGAFPRWLGRTVARNIKQSIPTLRGAQLAVVPESLDIYASIYNAGGTWNSHVFETCASLLQPGQVFWDIGANIGFMSIEMAQRFRDEVHVYSFEPQPALSKNIIVSAALNNFRNIHVFDVMLGAQEGEATLYVGSHSIHASAVAREKGSVHVTRQITTIDHLIQTGKVMVPHVIKMDIEGGELAAFSGAQELLSKHKPHLVFEADENMSRFGYQRSDILQKLNEFAPYKFFFITERNELIPLQSANADVPYSDILATVRE